MHKKTLLLLIAAVVTALAIGAGSATAGALITSKQIKDHSIKYKDLRKGAAKRLKGQTGPAGAQGVAGVKGVDGKAGLNGKDGKDGAAGVAGATGATGAVGPVGPAGAASTVPGPVGPAGAVGPAGPAGADSTVAGPAGPQGPAGPAGADSTVPGPQGPQGEPGIAGGVTIETAQIAEVSVATCPAGTTLIGGGGESSGQDYLLASMPDGHNGWVVKAKHNQTGVAYAICA